jgi:hypothetical protein
MHATYPAQVLRQEWVRIRQQVLIDWHWYYGSMNHKKAAGGIDGSFNPVLSKRDEV